MAESFENLDSILHDWSNDKLQKSRKHKIAQKKYSSSLSRQSSETKSSTKFVLVSQEPLLYHSPLKTMFMRLI